MQAQGTLVGDSGGYSIKLGMAGDTAPSWFERTCYCKGMDVFGDDAWNRDTGDQNLLRSPMDYLFIEYGDVGFSMMEELWRYVFRKAGKAPEEHPIVLTDKPMNPTGTREKITQIFFESFNVPAFYLAPSTPLPLYATCASSESLTGTVVDCGYGSTSVAVVVDGIHQIMLYFRPLDIGGQNFYFKIIEAMGDSRYRDPRYRRLAEEIFHKECYVASDCEQELNLFKSDSIHPPDQSYILPDGSSFSLGSNRFMIPEILFQPELDQREMQSLPSRIDWTLHHPNGSVEHRKALWNNIILTGGGSLLPGFTDRLEKELHKLQQKRINETKEKGKDTEQCEYPMKIVSLPERRFLTWIGASAMASLSTFQTEWISKEEYDEQGPSIVGRIKVKNSYQ